jgi:hypothetical protein
MHSQTTIEDLLAELDGAWQLALAKQDAMAMCEATWKKALLMGLVTDQIELRIILDGDGLTPGQAIEQIVTRIATTRRH